MARTFARSAPFALALLIPFSGIRLALHPEGLRLVALPLFIFVMVPLLDLVCGRMRATLEETPKARDWRYDVWLWLWVPMQLAALGLALQQIARGRPAEWWQLLVEASSMGLMAGLGINVAHELIHRPGRLERGLAELLMTCSTYTHFCVEHVYGHHRHVSTPLDPASARRGESVYAFLPRTLVGSLKSAWHLEGQRLRTAGVNVWSLRNRRIRYGLDVALAYALCAWVAGLRGVVFFAVQSAVGILLLEVINYIEHYGLSRRELSPGKFERCLPAHSWNASERLTNWFLFHLQRHADHHHLASRPYASLRHIDDSPQMPTGYAGMILLALVPPLWARVMHPRVDAWHAAGSSGVAAPP